MNLLVGGHEAEHLGGSQDVLQTGEDQWLDPVRTDEGAAWEGTDRIFDHDRTWLLHQVKRICRLAGVPEISAHGLRGTHADLSLHAHVTALAVSQALGHTSTEVTFGHYADRRIVDDHQQDVVFSVLEPTVPAAETGLPKMRFPRGN